MADKQEEKIEIKTGPAALTDVEIKASEKGWVPEKEWDGDPNDWRPAREFLDRGELMDRISSQTKQINQYDTKIQQLENNLKQLAEHNKKVAKLEYDKALADLKKRKANALDDGDHNAVVELDDQMNDLKQSQQETQNLEKAEFQPSPLPEVTAWMGENTWFNTDIALRGAAEAIAQQFVAANPTAEQTPSLVLNHVTEQIKKEFPEKFGFKSRPSGTVEPQRTGNSGTSRKKNKWTKSDLDETQKKFMESFCDEEFTEQDYINQLGELGELG